MNNNELKEIGQRLQGLREALDMSTTEFATSCSIPLDEYMKYESGEQDLTISTLKHISTIHNIDITVLMFNNEPRMGNYFLTRHGKGLAVNRMEENGYKYETLAGGFNNRKAEPFEVVIEPTNLDISHFTSKHQGQEFAYLLEGKLKFRINNKDLILEIGDSIYFDSNCPHAFKAMDNKRVRFISIIL